MAAILPSLGPSREVSLLHFNGRHFADYYPASADLTDTRFGGIFALWLRTYSPNEFPVFDPLPHEAGGLVLLSVIIIENQEFLGYLRYKIYGVSPVRLGSHSQSLYPYIPNVTNRGLNSTTDYRQYHYVKNFQAR
jgi:hypothetical protein